MLRPVAIEDEPGRDACECSGYPGGDGCRFFGAGPASLQGAQMMNFLMDPRAFNVVVIVWFLATALRWSFAGNWLQVGYWVSAAVLNVFVTAMEK